MPKPIIANSVLVDTLPTEDGIYVRYVPYDGGYRVAGNIHRDFSASTKPAVYPQKFNDTFCVGVWVRQPNGPMLVIASFSAVEVGTVAFSRSVLKSLARKFPSEVLESPRSNPAKGMRFLLNCLEDINQVEQEWLYGYVRAFAEWTFELCGPGNYIFDTTSPSVTVATYDAVGLLIYMDAIPRQRLAYVGFIPPELVIELSMRSVHSSVDGAVPNFKFETYDVSSFKDIRTTAIQLRSTFREVLEPIIVNNFKRRFDGEVRIYYGDADSVASTIQEFIKNLIVVWYPDWQNHKDQKNSYSWHRSSGISLVQITGNEEETQIVSSHMDADRMQFVDNTVEIVEYAVDFLTGELYRWEQRLESRNDTEPMRADDLVSAMRFLCRTMPKLAHHLDFFKQG